MIFLYRCYRSKVYLRSAPVCECLMQCSHRALNPSREKLPRAWRGASRTCEPVRCYRNTIIHRFAAVVAFLPTPLHRYTLFACELLINLLTQALISTSKHYGRIINKKFVISEHHARVDFLNANFVGYNHEAAVSNLFAESVRFSKHLLLLYQPLIC